MCPLDYEALKNKKSRQSGRGWQPKDGRNVLRVLPHTSRFYHERMTDFVHEYDVHFLRVENEMTVTMCPRSVGGYCPVCEIYWKYRNSEDAGLAKALQSVKPTDRHLMNVIDMNNVQAGIQGYEANYTVYHGILDYVSNLDWGDVLHPEAGRNFHIELTPAAKSPTKRNSYKVEPAPSASDIRQYLTADWLQALDRLETMKPDLASTEQILTLCRKLGLPEVDVPPSVRATLAPGTNFAPPAVPQAPVSQPPIVPPPIVPPTPVVVPAPAIPVTVPPPAVPPPPAVVAAPSDGGFPPTIVMGTDGRPTCFGKFNKDLYPCDHPCPIRVNCQMQAVGLGG